MKCEMNLNSTKDECDGMRPKKVQSLPCSIASVKTVTFDSCL